MEKKIDYNMNILRNIAILMVVLLHSNAMSMSKLLTGEVDMLSSAIIMFISAFTRIAVPIFVLISGRYLLNTLENCSLKEFYKKRLPRLIAPLIFWSVIYFFICLIVRPETTMISYIKDFVTGFAFNMNAIHIWYMYMLLGLYIVAPFIYKFIKEKSFKKQVIIGISFAIIGFLVEAIKMVTGINVWILWWCEFLGLFILGYVLRDFKIEKKKIGIFTISIIIIEIICTALSIILVLSGNQIGMIFHSGLIPTTQFVAIMVYLIFNSLNLKDGFLSKTSKYVLGIYLLHQGILIMFLRVDLTSILLLDIGLKVIIAYGISLLIISGLYKIKFLRKFIS